PLRRGPIRGPEHPARAAQTPSRARAARVCDRPTRRVSQVARRTWAANSSIAQLRRPIARALASGFAIAPRYLRGPARQARRHAPSSIEAWFRPEPNLDSV